MSFWGVPSHWHVAGSSETTKVGTWAESATQSVKVWRRGLMEEMGNGIDPIRPKAKTSLLQTCQNRFASNLHVNHGSAWAETSTAASEKRNMERKRKRERDKRKETNQPTNHLTKFPTNQPKLIKMETGNQQGPKYAILRSIC